MSTSQEQARTAGSQGDFGKPGLLLINLGTPDAPETPAVRRYLREFLSDPRVLDMNPIGRSALLNFVILPRRPKQSAAAYRQVWTPEGSPLLVNSQDLARSVAEQLPEAHVVLAMRYGSPSIKAGLAELVARGCDQITVFPLFPQYASSSTGSALEEVYREAGKLWNTPFIRVVPPFFDHPAFIDAFADVARPVLDADSFDHVLFSYHGLPERHVTKSDATGAHCLAGPNCCNTLNAANRQCYSAHCHATTRALSATLELAPERYSMAFQSRMGRTPWLQPFTDKVLVDLAQKGARKLAVLCPSFVADCLETLEEIAMRADNDFRAAGGEQLTLIPSLNATSKWVSGVAELARATF